MYLLRPHEKSDEALKRIIVEEFDEVIRLLTDSAASQDTVVHEIRKSMKKIRAALRLVRYEIGEELFASENNFYRETAQILAGSRDGAVMVETLDCIRNPEECHETAESPPTEIALNEVTPIEIIPSPYATSFEKIHQILLENKKPPTRNYSRIKMPSLLLSNLLNPPENGSTNYPSSIKIFKPSTTV